MFGDVSMKDLVQRRYSCRSYESLPIPEPTQAALRAFMIENSVGPFGSRLRLSLIAATDSDARALKGLGTYGFISGASGYIAGAVGVDAPLGLEDFGYVVERIVLYATYLELGTVWLGGTFTKSRFAKAMALGPQEELPAVVATGLPAARPRGLDALIRRGSRADRRLPWAELFCDGELGQPLSREAAGPYADVLEMVRLGPSASNKQPWRIVRAADGWRLYLQRTPGYRRRNALVGTADMQRIDMGIAMCHFALGAAETGLAGQWLSAGDCEPDGGTRTQLIATWVEA